MKIAEDDTDGQTEVAPAEYGFDGFRRLPLGSEATPFSVFVHLRRTNADLLPEMIQSSGRSPDQITSYADTLYAHWKVADFESVTQMVGAIWGFGKHPDLLVFQVMSRVFGDECITLKDSRRG